MTSSTSTSVRATLSTPQKVSMVAGPSLLLAGFAIHPEEGSNAAEMIRTIAANQGAFQASHVLLFLAAIVLIPAALALGRLVTGPEHRTASIASGLIVFASVGLGGAAAFEQLVGVAAALPADAAAMTRLVEAAESSSVVMATLYAPQLAVVLGFLTMAWALFRSGTVPTWAAALMAVGAVGVMAPEPGRCIAVAFLLTTFVVALRRSVTGEATVPAEVGASRTVASLA